MNDLYVVTLCCTMDDHVLAVFKTPDEADQWVQHNLTGEDTLRVWTEFANRVYRIDASTPVSLKIIRMRAVNLGWRLESTHKTINLDELLPLVT